MLARLALSLLLVLLASAPAQNAPTQTPDMSNVPWSPVRRNAAPAPAQSAPTISVNVKLVNVFASVADGNGAPYAGLQKEDFRIYEDGIEQTLSIFEHESELPLSIALDLDTSLSTRKDLALETASARKFAHIILRPVDSISLYEFSTFVSQALPYTSDERRLDVALNHLRTGAATAVYDAICLQFHLAAAAPGTQGYRPYLSDGGDTASKVDYPEALRAAQIAEAIIYPIIMVPIEADAGRDTGGEHALIQLSRDTGGKFFYATSLAQLDDAFRQINDELRTQYLLAYYPIKRAGSEFRRITVDLTAEAKQRAQRELYVCTSRGVL